LAWRGEAGLGKARNKARLGMARQGVAGQGKEHGNLLTIKSEREN